MANKRRRSNMKCPCCKHPPPHCDCAKQKPPRKKEQPVTVKPPAGQIDKFLSLNHIAYAMNRRTGRNNCCARHVAGAMKSLGLYDNKLVTSHTVMIYGDVVRRQQTTVHVSLLRKIYSYLAARL